MVQSPKRLIDLPGVFDEHRAELDQAKSRIWMTVGAFLYIFFRWISSGSIIPGPENTGFLILPLSNEVAVHLFLFCLAYAVFGIVFLAVIRIYPGHFVLRRIVTISCDFGALTYLMFIGESPMMIFFALVLWIAVGNGMRFGQQYLLIAPLLAQISLLLLVLISPFWQQRIDVVITISVSAIILPIYSIVLLRRISMAQDTAQAALQSKSRFLAQASHDLRQPIHSVGFYLDILRTTGTEIERNKLIDRIERAVGSVSRLFKSLLDISRVDSGTIEVVAETIALDAMLADIVQQNEQHAYWNNVELRYVPTRFKARADPTLLATMVQNLVSNAIKYSHGAKVLVGARRKGDSIAIEIYDQGIGIDANHLPHIFEEFYRAHEAGDRDAEGVGLGLAIVARLALLSGFKVTVNSQRNKGTMARISGIPVSARQITSAPVIDGWIAKPLDKFRVILIEDDRDVLDATRTLLGLWGCDVQSYAEMPIHVRPADVIVADFDLGDGQLGTDAIRTIRSQHGEAIPAILMTGHSGPQIEQHIDRLDVQILSKPVQPATLRSVLSSIRSRSRG